MGHSTLPSGSFTLWGICKTPLEAKGLPFREWEEGGGWKRVTSDFAIMTRMIATVMIRMRLLMINNHVSNKYQGKQ